MKTALKPIPHNDLKTFAKDFPYREQKPSNLKLTMNPCCTY